MNNKLKDKLINKNNNDNYKNKDQINLISENNTLKNTIGFDIS